MSQILYGRKHGRFLKIELDWAKCGTAANYRGHHRRGEKPCDACIRAHNRARADSKRRCRSRATPDAPVTAEARGGGVATPK